MNLPFAAYARLLSFIAVALLLLATTASHLPGNLQSLHLAQYMFGSTPVSSIGLGSACGAATDAAEALRTAKLLVVRTEYASAEACVQTYLNQGGHSLLALVLATQLAAVRGDWTSAVELAEQSPPSVHLPLYKVYRAAQARQFEDALHVYEQGVAQLNAAPLFEQMVQQILAQLHTHRLKSAPHPSAAYQLALATQYWRLSETNLAQRLVDYLLSVDEQFDPRQSAWAFFLAGEFGVQRGDATDALQAYRAGVEADSLFLPNIWGALALLQHTPRDHGSLRADLLARLETITPEGNIRSDLPSDLLGYTLAPEYNLAPEGRYDLFLFWRLDAPSARQPGVIQTERWAIQRLSLYNQVPYGQFNPAGVGDDLVEIWGHMIIPGHTEIEASSDNAGGVLRLAPAKNNDRVLIRSTLPTRGLPVQPQNRYLLTMSARARGNGVVTLGCVWTVGERIAEYDAQGSRSYVETYSQQWENVGIVLSPPENATACTLQVGFLFGTEGMLDHIRLFELPKDGETS